MSDTKDKVIATIQSSNLPDSIKKAFGDVKAMSKLNQILIGGSSGLATGYVVSKVGKITGVVVGGGLIMFQVAQHFGYIQINWKKVRKDLEKQKDRTIKAIKKSGANEAAVEGFLNDAKNFLTENITFALSFSGGFLIGFAF